MRAIFLYLLAFGLLIGPELFAQSFTFSLLSSEGNKPIAFAHLQVKGTLYGGLSDIDGRCKIQIESEDLDGQLIISYMGFESLTIPIAELKRDELNLIHLKEGEIQLAEFKVIDIGMTPQEFLQKTINLADKTFDTKHYTGLATYEEEVVEDGKPTFNYAMDVQIEAQGFRNAKGKNRHIGNDKAYLLNVNQIEGSQKYSAVRVGKMVGFAFPYGDEDMEDSYFTRFLMMKNSFEKSLFIDSKMVFTGDWFFEDLYTIGEETYVKVTKESADSRVSFDIDRNTNHIRSIEVISPFRTGRNVMSSYLTGDVDFRVDYFKVEGKSYLKSVVINQLAQIITDSVNLTKLNKGKLVFHRLVDEKPDKEMEINEEFIREKIYK